MSEGDIDRVQRTDVGASIAVEFKRGTGTRDQDKWTIKGKGETAAEAIKNFERELEEVEDEFAQRVRDLQVEVTEEDDE
ncbi:hypothetical protein PM038_00120 [Halorubrum ezzemoulense]|uniref:DUF7389 domain-containing protein n=1 Tax=Halorubrum ezzemoulense TaxID=337243 RepID=UPI00232C2310|nr:hypothetical protein [Halorubrum ezzemoulense]MDB2283680.1 hypothetical protein [Halorubrum ezzemoulense]